MARKPPPAEALEAVTYWSERLADAKISRDAQIRCAYNKGRGHSLRAIAEAAGLSPEWVRKVVSRDK